jgi:hypothetical protein
MARAQPKREALERKFATTFEDSRFQILVRGTAFLRSGIRIPDTHAGYRPIHSRLTVAAPEWTILTT